MKQVSIDLPGDKSLSHRAAIFASMAKGKSRIKNFLAAEDTLHTLKAFEKLGVNIQQINKTEYKIDSFGYSSFQNKVADIYVGNSGTGARLLTGLFAGTSGIQVTLDGDKSLRKRPMKRITEPLMAAGAHIEPSDHLPYTVYGKKLLPIFWEEKLGSAQVKSALILAAIASQQSIRLEEKKPSRDHTENMLRYAGVFLEKEPAEEGYIIELEPDQVLNPMEYHILSDASSAAFFLVLGLHLPNLQIKANRVLLNPYRIAYLDVLEKMGAKLHIQKISEQCGEQGGHITTLPSELTNVSISSNLIPALIDELPILTIAAALSKGEFSFRGAKELRKKESDRIHALVTNLRILGYEVEEYEDGLSFIGNPNYIPEKNVKLNSFYDHRIIMSFEIFQAIVQKRQNVTSTFLSFDDTSWVQTSFPEFYFILQTISLLDD
ncbi:MAG: 3-phosphoshikimate 1-carboxyvinyltransferase [Candidatus Hydrogenedentota bacterium]|nr:MAG: 3-phosphoshikimate 1-carboxyvinyltransferase [Candidatus Hydrogenedentota bacterium]